MDRKITKRPMKVFACAECGEMDVRQTTPKSDGCRRHIFHRWVNLGEEGDQRYACSHCKMIVRTTATPSTFGCVETKFHSWTKVR